MPQKSTDLTGDPIKANMLPGLFPKKVGAKIFTASPPSGSVMRRPDSPGMQKISADGAFLILRGPLRSSPVKKRLFSVLI